MEHSPAFLCLTCYFKGADFIKACHALGNTVYLITSKKLENEPWPWDSIQDVYYMEEDEEGDWDLDDLVRGLAYVLRTIRIDRILALDDFDVERVAMLREEFRYPGMGQSTARFFRDKLAMRMEAKKGGIPVPAFSSLFRNELINHFADTTVPPWVVKPRSEASAAGIRKVHDKNELWSVINELGDKRHRYLVEQFLPGDVYHVDALSYQGDNLFTKASRYLNTPFEVAHGGGIFRTQTLEDKSDDAAQLAKINQDLLDTFGMRHSASHSEYIKAHDDGKFYFLETSSRVGGAHIAEMVEAASGINLWREWAALESAMVRRQTYQLPPVENWHAGSIMSLSKFESPDDSTFTDQEIWWRLKKKNHIGFILKSDRHGRISELLDQYAERIRDQFHASLPAPDRPTG